MEVQVNDGQSTTPVLSFSENTGGWSHAWTDLTPWAGKTITLTFVVHQVAGFPQTWAYLDEVSIGSSYPDVWVSESVAPRARPGQPIVFTIAYGNRGGAPASGVELTDVLPDGLMFASSDPPASGQAPNLVWSVGDLPARSGPFTIVVTATATSGTFANPVTITTTSDELETMNNQAETEVWVGNGLYVPLIVRGW